MFSERSSINRKKDSQSHHLSTRIGKEEPIVLCYNNSDKLDCINGCKRTQSTNSPLPLTTFVRGTEQEAKDACDRIIVNRWIPYQRGGYSWINSQISEEYTMFEQFGNGYGIGYG
jgi:hypothetical protein